VIRRRALAVLSAVALTGALAACSGGASASSGGSSDGGPVNVVAATNVWGDIAASIGGSHVKVTSIIDDPDKDPHEYQADARTQLAISKAKVVIENGGGYDDFVPKMIKASKNTSAEVVNAVDISGFTGDDLNEHVWYDYPTVSKVVDAIESALAKADSAHAADYKSNATAFQTQLTGLEDTEKTLSAKTSGVGVGITEPVPDYVLQALKTDIVTPEAFSKAIEDDTDVPATVLQETEAQYANGDVKVLVYNAQTTGPQTEAVLSAAKKANVPVVPVTETLPTGKHYIDWQQGVLDAIAKALNAG
jgi:zinc/manganese transport system substrate-binding protein